MKYLSIALFSLVFSTFALADLHFSRDVRPQDGDLKQLNISGESSRHEARVVLTSTFVDRRIVQNVTQVLMDEDRMDCSVTPQLVVCVKDLRPADGAKIELFVRKNRSGTYDVVRQTSIVNRANGQDVVTNKTLATDLNKI